MHFLGLLIWGAFETVQSETCERWNRRRLETLLASTYARLCAGALAAETEADYEALEACWQPKYLRLKLEEEPHIEGGNPGDTPRAPTDVPWFI